MEKCYWIEYKVFKKSDLYKQLWYAAKHMFSGYLCNSIELFTTRDRSNFHISLESSDHELQKYPFSFFSILLAVLFSISVPKYFAFDHLA